MCHRENAENPGFKSGIYPSDLTTERPEQLGPQVPRTLEARAQESSHSLRGPEETTFGYAPGVNVGVCCGWDLTIGLALSLL